MRIEARCFGCLAAQGHSGLPAAGGLEAYAGTSRTLLASHRGLAYKTAVRDAMLMERDAAKKSIG